jgi:hypothetical protein
MTEDDLHLRILIGKKRQLRERPSRARRVFIGFPRGHAVLESPSCVARVAREEDGPSLSDDQIRDVSLRMSRGRNRPERSITEHIHGRPERRDRRGAGEIDPFDAGDSAERVLVKKKPALTGLSPLALRLGAFGGGHRVCHCGTTVTVPPVPDTREARLAGWRLRRLVRRRAGPLAGRGDPRGAGSRAPRRERSSCRTRVITPASA